MQKGVDYIGIAVVPFAHDGNGKYLFGLRTESCRDEQHCWEPTGGGGLEFGETIEEGVFREMYEELGVEPFNLEFLGTREVFRVNNISKTHWLAFDYRVQVDPKKVKIMEPEMCSELRWCTLDKIPDPLHSQFPFFLEKYKDLL